MTEDQNDQTNEGPQGDPNPETAPNAVPETTSQAAIPLPAVTPPAFEQPLPLPQQPDTPPMGFVHDQTPPAGSTPPQGTYAMGALAGNPMLGAAPASSFGTPPPTNPGAPTWSAPPATARNEWREQPPRPERPPGWSRRPGGPGRRLRHRPCNDEQWWEHTGLQPDFGQLASAFESRVLRRLELLRGIRLLGEPLRQRLRRASATREAPATRAAAARVHRAPRVRVMSTPSRPRSTPASSTSTRHSATSRSRPPARASCSRPTA